MGSLEIGLALPIFQFGPERTTPRWTEMREMARLSEETGFDTIWIADELLWQVEGASPQGAWEGVSIGRGRRRDLPHQGRIVGVVCPPSQPGHHRKDCGNP